MFPVYVNLSGVVHAIGQEKKVCSWGARNKTPGGLKMSASLAGVARLEQCDGDIVTGLSLKEQ